jgi:hypothetical protein
VKENSTVKKSRSEDIPAIPNSRQKVFSTRALVLNIFLCIITFGLWLVAFLAIWLWRTERRKAFYVVIGLYSAFFIFNAVFIVPNEKKASQETTSGTTSRETTTVVKPVAPLVTIGDLEKACSLHAVRQAGDYSGVYHPLVVLNDYGSTMMESARRYIPGFPRAASSTASLEGWKKNSGEKVQLVACRGEEKRIFVDSCGKYSLIKIEGGKEKETHIAGELLRYRTRVIYRVVVAKTGKILKYKGFDGTVPVCPSRVSESELDNDVFKGDPPWRLSGDAPETDMSNTEFVTYLDALTGRKPS